jgi:hypothetical protein
MKPVLQSSQNWTRTQPKKRIYRAILLMQLKCKNPFHDKRIYHFMIKALITLGIERIVPQHNKGYI